MSKWMLSPEKTHIVDLEGRIICVFGDEEAFQDVIIEHNSDYETIEMIKDLYRFMSSLSGKNVSKATNRLATILGKINKGRK